MSFQPNWGIKAIIPRVGILVWCFLMGGLLSCSESQEPIDRMNAIVNGLTALSKEPGEDIRVKKDKIEAYWNSKEAEIALIKQSLADKIAQSQDRIKKQEFVLEFDTLVEKLLEIKKILHDQGIEL